MLQLKIAKGQQVARSAFGFTSCAPDSEALAGQRCFCIGHLGMGFLKNFSFDRILLLFCCVSSVLELARVHQHSSTHKRFPRLPIPCVVSLPGCGFCPAIRAETKTFLHKRSSRVFTATGGDQSSRVFTATGSGNSRVVTHTGSTLA